MPEAAISDYFYGDEAEQFIYFRIPRQLITDPRFKHLSTDAKLLYGMLLDRMSLSIKSGWLDKQGRVYIIFTADEIMEALCCADNKATKLMKELGYHKGYKYAHDFEGNFVEQQFLPDGLTNERLWHAQDNPAERVMAERLRALWKGRY